MRKRAQRTARRRKPIDYADIRASTPAQLAAFCRVGRPSIGDQARQLIAIRLNARVLAEFRKEAKRRKVGCQTLINDVLANT